MKKTDASNKDDQNKTTNRDDLKIRIIKVAIDILNEGGRDSLTTRSVSDSAGIQAPTLYRLFGDMRGLLDAIVEYCLIEAFEKKKEHKPGPDPVEDLRLLWAQHINFGLENPAIYSLMWGEIRPGFVPPARIESKKLLTDLIQRIALTGRMRVSESRAADLIYATSSGVVLSLLNTSPDQRDPGLAKSACDAVIAAITYDFKSDLKAGFESSAIALKAALPEVSSLSAGERLLMSELLDRISLSR